MVRLLWELRELEREGELTRRDRFTLTDGACHLNLVPGRYRTLTLNGARL